MDYLFSSPAPREALIKAICIIVGSNLKLIRSAAVLDSAIFQKIVDITTIESFFVYKELKIGAGF